MAAIAKTEQGGIMATTDVLTPLRPSLLPVPPDFPSTWEHPEDAQLFWMFDPVGSPSAMPPLDYAFQRDAYLGFNSAAAAYELPTRMDTRYINTYLYTAIVPVGATPEVLETLARLSEERLDAAMTRLGRLWDTEWLPEVQAHLAYWQAFDLRGATLPVLLAHMDETVARSRRVWDIHFQLIFPTLLAMSLFEEFYRDLFGSEKPFDTYRLLQGFDNKTLEADRALWQLSRQARAAPAVRRVIEASSATDVAAALEHSPAGHAFLADLRAYLEMYGQRCNDLILSAPRWIEDPTPVIANLQNYISQPDRDLIAEQAALAAERDQLVAQARARLNGYPAPVVEQFELFLTAAQAATVLSEEHAFWIDYGCPYQVRRVVLEFGRRFAETGAIDQPADIFYLTLDELRETASTPPGIDSRSLVGERTAEVEHFRAITPPPALGTQPAEPPADDPLSRAMGKFFGAPPQPATEPDVVRGNAGSPGIVRGSARVIRTLAEADRLQQGDVLVTMATLPPWTPLFATAAAVVTDVGGILSHCAVVAREYGIPAVVGTGVATAVIQEGQMLEVDGNAGMVRIIASV
jgi:pyruvate,water dikinase